VIGVDGRSAQWTGSGQKGAESQGDWMAEARIVQVSLNGGGIKTIATLSPHEIGSVTMTRDARTVVYTAYSSRSDVWIVDNFDGAVR
jgi:hypothetical protein